MKQYEELQERHQKDLNYLNGRFNSISMVRFLIAVSFAIIFHQYYKTEGILVLIPLFILPAAFFVVMKIHQKTDWQRKLKEILIKINKDEIGFLKGAEIPFENGREFSDTTHPYSYDLDLFGAHSLFQTLNRTGTHMGKNRLAFSLLHRLPAAEITSHQDAIQELQSETEWRHHLLALAGMKSDSKESYENLISWVKEPNPKIPSFLLAASFITPVLTIASLLIYFLTPYSIFGNIGFLLILLNLSMLSTQVKRINNENFHSGEIDKILRQYSLIMKEIENGPMKSELLKELQQRLHFKELAASQKISRLSTLFARLDFIQNIFAAFGLNGLLLYHIHVLRGLYKWREECREEMKHWLEVIGEFESLGSYANFFHNNPDFAFPQLNTTHEISFEGIGHPLIGSAKRVTNDVSFSKYPFFILTGSNMSGKSTFLRTLGVNMVLANAGSPVCASKANLHPLQVLLSMRLSDSLSDSESYFFAEVRRLKEIADTLDNEVCFVLLDEILRGTNSDDKRSGTIEVIKKMVAKKAIGAIATHDLEVCRTTDEHPDVLTNKRFEVEISNDELVFDYKLRDGICENKSATFLMKKMGVI